MLSTDTTACSMSEINWRSRQVPSPLLPRPLLNQPLPCAHSRTEGEASRVEFLSLSRSSLRWCLQAIKNTKKISKLQGKVSAGQQAIVSAQTQLEERGLDTASLQQRMDAMQCRMSGEVHSLQQELCEAWRKHKVLVSAQQHTSHGSYCFDRKPVIWTALHVLESCSRRGLRHSDTARCLRSNACRQQVLFEVTAGQG